MGKLGALARSRRFWVAVADVVVTVGHEALGIPAAALVPLTTVAVAWIVGDSYRPAS